MKRLFKVFVALSLFCGSLPAMGVPFRGLENNTGVGVGIGSVDGISLYQRFRSDAFGQFLVAFSDSVLYLDADLCTAYVDALPRASYLVPYYCFGVFFADIDKKKKDFLEDAYDDTDVKKKDKDINIIGARLPLGVQLFIPNTPLLLSLQVAPGLALSPGTDVFMHYLLSFRVLF